MSKSVQLVGAAHGRLVHGRRVQRLAQAIAPLLDPSWHVLDIGCGDGQLASLIAHQRQGLSITGYDVLVRQEAAIRVLHFDGQRIPVADRAVDAVMLVDVLHHTQDPMVLLREAARVATKAVLIKDHRMARPLAYPTLRFMDWVGNRAHGVVLPYNYWPEARWRDAWQQIGMTPDHYQTRLGLYPFPAHLVFEKGLHFVTRLRPTGAAQDPKAS